MQEFTAGSNDAGQRLDKWLVKYLDKAPKSFIYKMLRKKNIKLNGNKASGSEKLVNGDVITLYLADATIEEFSKTAADITIESDLDIIYEDEHILLLNKPAGMLSQRAAERDISLVEHIIAYMAEKGVADKESLKRFRPSVCNRLDRNTSGIVIAGKSLTGLQEMSEMLRERTMSKFYRCIVKGRLCEEQEIDGYLYKDERSNRVGILKQEEPGARYIRTKYKPVSVSDSYTYLEVELITGRSHQIRAHLASVGHPIAGDQKYGNYRWNEQCRTQFGLRHQLLHAYRLQFPEIDGPLDYLSGRTFQAEEPELFRRMKQDLFQNGV